MEEVIYTYILIKKLDNTLMGWSKSEEEKPAVSGMEWEKWNKSLPEDINFVSYKYENGTLKAV